MMSRCRDNDSLGSKQLHALVDGQHFNCVLALLGQVIYFICDCSVVKLEQQVSFESWFT